ncbi:CHAP domain-containing protein [Mammaliicoccus lentus]|uniref:CHAP domain-containing protein n=1 Tax=Mammaliicoccus lentus TaxID=42858 RepID=UPI001F3DF294|nr:glucosaminidase domain-containing protein [Mammaliicoccus lentus]
MTDKTIYKVKSPKWLKGLCSIALVSGICIQDHSPIQNTQSNIANASDLPVIDAQFNCNVDGDDKESSSDDTDISPKDSNIDVKKFKKEFEKNAKGGALEGKTDKIIEIADKEKVPPLLMAAIIAHESSWGKAANATKQKNPMSVMGSATIHDTQFDTIEDGMKEGAKNLYSGYIKKGLDTPKKIQPKYAPTEGATNDPEGSNNNWLPTVESIMKSIGGESNLKSSSTNQKDDDKESEGASSADSSNDTENTNPCEDDGDSKQKDKDDDTGSAKGGDSVKANGKSGKQIAGQWTKDEIPSKYKKYIKIPDFDEKYIDKPGNHFVTTNNIGECTELTWAYMNQMHGQGQPADDGNVTNGERVHEVYKAKGAKTTHNPTVGYGFSSKPPYALASIPGVGHTGVVAGVLPDGKFIIAQYNVPPDPAPSRTVLYSVIDGVPKDAGDDLIFFSGINGHTKVKGMK